MSMDKMRPKGQTYQQSSHEEWTKLGYQPINRFQIKRSAECLASDSNEQASDTYEIEATLDHID
jgi:hypothetical protein